MKKSNLKLRKRQNINFEQTRYSIENNIKKIKSYKPKDFIYDPDKKNKKNILLKGISLANKESDFYGVKKGKVRSLHKNEANVKSHTSSKKDNDNIKDVSMESANTNNKVGLNKNITETIPGSTKLPENKIFNYINQATNIKESNTGASDEQNLTLSNKTNKLIEKDALSLARIIIELKFALR